MDVQKNILQHIAGSYDANWALPNLERFFANLPEKPYCGNNKIISHILPKEKAIQFQYIQINHPLCIRYIIVDLDYARTVFAYEKHNLPPFTITTVNPSNGHCHGVYEIEPVFWDYTTEKTKNLLRLVVAMYRELLSADKAIVRQRQLTKNPFHDGWGLIILFV